MPQRKKKFSAPMAIVLAETIDHGGVLHRHGGVWSYPSCPLNREGALAWSVCATSVDALVTRGELEYIEYRSRRGTRVPVVAKVKEAA
jgi:hypothetical protein